MVNQKKARTVDVYRITVEVKSDFYTAKALLQAIDSIANLVQGEVFTTHDVVGFPWCEDCRAENNLGEVDPGY